MKLSIAWIFDHIKADWKKQNIDTLISRFNQSTAEIERSFEVKFDLSSFFLGIIQKRSNNEITLEVPELSTTVTLGSRRDIPEKYENCGFLLKKESSGFRFVECSDFNLDKVGMLGAFEYKEKDLLGEWRTKFETEDIILEVDNKSITHRPDMWGHRGFAKEVAALLDLELKDNSDLLEKHKIFETDAQEYRATKENPISIKNEVPTECHKIATLYFEEIENGPSSFFVASRLIKVGSRSINAIVDLTNYVMLDWSQPMHAFDAKKISGNNFIIRFATEAEKLTLLDGKEIELFAKDLVTADQKQALGLAGIMGGAKSGIEQNTSSILLESANFDATVIRKSALHHKTRTEASARFEKTLDPNQATEAILRFLFLANQFGINYIAKNDLVVLGKKAKESNIEISHEYIEKRAGFSISKEVIKSTLSKLGFKIDLSDDIYKITVPTYRNTKDIKIKEDIIEEIIRFFGFNNITPKMPAFVKMPYDLSPTFRKRKIKQRLSLRMNEVYNYALYDEQFINLIGIARENETHVKNPISENSVALVTSLIPHLIKNVHENINYEDQLSFFELSRRWKIIDNKIDEKRSLAGIIFNKREKVDFYKWKSYLNQLFELLEIPVEWSKKFEAQDLWFDKNRTACLTFGETVIGFAGNINPLILRKIDALEESDAFIFELDADFLINHQPEVIKFKPISKYQETSFDLSFIIPLSLTASIIETSLKKVDNMISNVYLIDFFEKEDWINQRALAFRITLNDPNKTLQKHEIDDIRQRTISTIESLGAKLRS